MCALPFGRFSGNNRIVMNRSGFVTAARGGNFALKEASLKESRSLFGDCDVFFEAVF